MYVKHINPESGTPTFVAGLSPKLAVETVDHYRKNGIVAEVGREALDRPLTHTEEMMFHNGYINEAKVTETPFGPFWSL